MARTVGGTVTVLFTDLVNSTDLLQHLGDDQYDKVRLAHFRLLRAAIMAHSGQEVKTVGDSLMAVFASAVDALAYAVSIQQAIHHNNEQEEPDHRLAMRVGLAAGEPIRDEGDYFGTPVVIARRLCDSAAGGQIVASELVRGLVGSRGGHTFRELGQLRLKGIAQPVAACEVLWEPLSEEAALAPPAARLVVPLPPALAGERAGFVGRKRELGELHKAWTQALAGERRLVLLAGEAGIGKTRMAGEFALAAHEKGATVLFGACYEEALLPYQPFVEALRHLVTASPDAPLRMAGGATELGRLIPELAHPSDWASRERLRSDAENDRYRLFEAVTSLLADTSHDRPLVLVLDDLHWADKPTLLLLGHIMRSPEQAQLLVIGTYRTTDVTRTHPLALALADLRRERLFERLSLKGLDESQVASLIGAWAGSDPTPTITRTIFDQTEGNPFFVEELLRHLAETGAIHEEEGGWVTDLTIAQIGIPEGVRDVIGRRLNRLSEECNRSLAIASVLGRDFELATLERVSDLSSERLLEAMEEAVAAHIVSEVAGAVDRYSFSHALIHETLYDELSAARRVRLHRRIGEALEELSRAAPDRHLAELAYHFTEAAQHADDADKAIAYATRAAERATSLLAYEEAAIHCQRALQALELKEPAPGDQCCDLLLALGDAQWMAGDTPKARETFQRAAGIARKLQAPELLARAAIGFGMRGMVVGVVDEVLLALLEEALSALGDGDSALRATVLARLADELYFSEMQERRLALTQEALAMARRIGDPATLAAALRSRRLALHGPQDADERIAAGTEILRLAEEAGDKVMTMTGHSHRTIDLLELGDVAGATFEVAAVRQLAEELRQPRYVWLSAQAEAMLALLQGRYEEGERLAQEGLAYGQRAHAPDAAQAFGVQLFLLRRDQHRLGELETAVMTFAEQNPSVPAWRCALAYVYSELGREDEARTEFERLASDGFACLRLDVYRLGGLVLLAEVCASLEDARRAAVLYELLLPYAARNVVITQVACTGAAARSLGVLAATMGQWANAARHFEDAIDMNARMRARPWLAAAQYDYASMLLRRSDRGDQARAQELLSEAATTAEELGMQRLSERARALQPGTEGSGSTKQ